MEMGKRRKNGKEVKRERQGERQKDRKKEEQVERRKARVRCRYAEQDKTPYENSFECL